MINLAPSVILSDAAVFAAFLIPAVLLYRFITLRQPRLVPRPILTANEREFFQRLTRALPALHVFPQVSLGALLDASPSLSARVRDRLRYRYGWKIADFAVCRPGNLSVVAIVELDDRTHDAAKDRKRDAMLRAAGYHTQGYQSRAKPSEAEITEFFSRMSGIQ